MDERRRRWRLLLGQAAEERSEQGLDEHDRGMDQCLRALYGEGGDPFEPKRRGAGLGGSAPIAARWLADVRRYFDSSVVRVLQRDAIDRLGLERMLLEPEMLAAVEPDVNLVATLIALKGLIPARAKEAARDVVRKVCRDLMEKLREPLRSAVFGALHRADRTNRRPRLAEIDWARTIARNLKHYQPELGTIVPQELRGFGRRRQALKEVFLCVDQSGSMANSVVYASLFAAVLASIPSVATHLIVFDTAVCDLTAELRNDPVDVLFGVQLGGGTDIERAVAATRAKIQRPTDSTLVLITDLFEGGDADRLVARLAELVHAGVTVVTLLALSDQGAPVYDRALAERVSQIGIPCFACTPDHFPALMGEALRGGDLRAWASLWEEARNERRS